MHRCRVRTWVDVLHYYCINDLGWRRLKVKLKQPCRLCVEGWFGCIRSEEELPNFPPAGLEPLPRTSVALRVMQYLNVCRRKLGTFIIQTVHFLQHDTGAWSQAHCQRGNFCFFATCFQITKPGSNTAVVSLRLCTNRGGLYKKYQHLSCNY